LNFDTSFVHDTVASIAFWMLDWMKLAKTFICSMLIKRDDTTDSSKLLRSLSTFMRFHALLCLNDVELISSVSVIRIDMWFDDWSRSNRVSQLITLFTSQSIMKTRSIVLLECLVFQIIVSIDNVSCMRVYRTTSMSWFVASCWVDLKISFYIEWCKLKSSKRTCSSSSFSLLLIVSMTIKTTLEM
jgi:hypothetical protein